MRFVIAVIIFSVVILIHELGHFLLAKKNHIEVLEFSLGMGPRIISTVKGGTRYSVKLFPLGGSCAMAGEDAEDDSPGTFNSAPVWGRIAVVAAGPVFNFLLAFILSVIIVGCMGYDPATVLEVTQNSAADKAGLKKGDVIKAVDGADVTDKETSDIASMVRDSEKDSVMLTIQRENEEKTRDVKVEIRDVEIQTVSHEMLSEDTGYIRISEFSEVTSDQYKKAFADLKDQGMKKLVVDLRDNPGGLLTAVCGVLRQILPEGLIVYTEDKNGKKEEETCDGKNELDMPLAVLVNGNSASASEIFAGAVKDYGIGTIVGTTTYGKGVVQTIQPLTDGSAVKITIAKYFTPKGNDINKKGITPDVEAELSGDITDWTELTHKEDTQLQTALKEIGQS